MIKLIRTLVVYNDGTYKLDLSIDMLEDKDVAWFWVDFSEPKESETSYLETFFKFDPLAIEDCLNYLQRPKMNYYTGYRFMVLQALKDGKDAEELDIFLSSKYAVTYCKHNNEEINMVWERIKKYKNLKDMKAEQILYFLSDEIVDNFFPIAHDIEDKIQDIEELGSISDQNMIEDVRKQLSRLSKLRKSVNPMRDLMYRILNSTHVEICEDTKHRLHDVYDHLVKLSNIIDENREMAKDIRESYISTNSHKMNQIMKTLTSLSIIFIPPTFLVGVYGMNFANMPELQSHYGYYIIWIVILASSFGLWSVFRRKGWF